MEIQTITISESDSKLISDFIAENIGLIIDFNHLMPVVEKIKTLTYENNWLESTKLWPASTLINCDLPTTYQAVLQFIQFYSTNPK